MVWRRRVIAPLPRFDTVKPAALGHAAAPRVINFIYVFLSQFDNPRTFIFPHLAGDSLVSFLSTFFDIPWCQSGFNIYARGWVERSCCGERERRDDFHLIGSVVRCSHSSRHELLAQRQDLFSVLRVYTEEEKLETVHTYGLHNELFFLVLDRNIVSHTRECAHQRPETLFMH